RHLALAPAGRGNLSRVDKPARRRRPHDRIVSPFYISERWNNITRRLSIIWLFPPIEIPVRGSVHSERSALSVSTKSITSNALAGVRYFLTIRNALTDAASRAAFKEPMRLVEPEESFIILPLRR